MKLFGGVECVTCSSWFDSDDDPVMQMREFLNRRFTIARKAQFNEFWEIRCLDGNNGLWVLLVLLNIENVLKHSYISMS